mmetsp:Transcript_19314/g.44915  ORF Transcript_19314/g.44915 Transcript_19314/m.44915 type:complete len:284 (-) Transcript_19314:420-1271(-)|eukprot:CAMPEP_0197173496 /NCGR_PEP_ID=MMETSP1423-20130617/403_1 /TAXON_ID=476441 /ORGANISM="Pseudo-nitzschia heimii, Strain UNC1101" /LENGTH=283 /DNA_ID=CAMNT_0042622319 /DNA_START=123 /DNA_END=974 /DNA_ORIENTATION=+
MPNTDIPTIHYEFPAVHGEVFLHAFCVLDAESVTAGSTMPESFHYTSVKGPFHSNTVLFQDEPDIVPKGRVIRERGQCRGGTYIQPSHEYYRGEKDDAAAESEASVSDSTEGAAGTPFFNRKKKKKKKSRNHGFSYDGATFWLDAVPSLNMDVADPSVTICAFIPDPSLWGQLTGGWDIALRNRGFKQATFEDSGDMVWEIHCKEVTSMESTMSHLEKEREKEMLEKQSPDEKKKSDRKKKKKQTRSRNWLRGQGSTPILVDKLDRHRPISTEDQRLRRRFLF